MPAPHPKVIRRELRELMRRITGIDDPKTIDELIKPFMVDYVKAHDFAYTAGGLSSTESGRRSSQVDYTDPTGEAAMPDRIDGQGNARPGPSVKGLARHKVTLAGQYVQTMVACLRVAQDAVDEAWPRTRRDVEIEELEANAARRKGKVGASR